VFDPRGPLEGEGYFADEMTRLKAWKDGIETASRLGVEGCFQFTRIAADLSDILRAVEASMSASAVSGAPMEPERVSAAALVIREARTCINALADGKETLRLD